MSLHPIDGAILLGLLSLVVGSALYARRFSKSVADFLSANRCAGRYLLTISDGIAGLGAISIIAMWESYHQGGLASLHWAQTMAPLALVLAMSGWVVYRYRQTRSQTLAEFLERRYSRRFRLFMGSLCFVSGVLNYGIFPAVTARFLVHFLELPMLATQVPLLGLELNWTLGLVMALLLGVALTVTLNGGQIAVMISDFMQGQISNLCFLVLLVVILWLIPWSDITETLRTAEPGQSKLNPFDQSDLPDFNPIYYLMTAMLMVYGYRVWQGSQGYAASATSPHEAKMANVLAVFRSLITTLLIPMAAVAAWVLLNGDAQPAAAAEAHASLDALAASGGEQVARQLTTTVAMRELLPIGMIGLLAAVMVMASVSTDSTYLHSWASILVQDVLNPARQLSGREPLPTDSHLKVLKRAVAGVAAFVWCFSMVFPVQEYVFMYFQATGAIFTGGAGAVVVGGLYWRRGTTTAAWTAMLVGSTLAVSGVMTINVLWPWGVPRLQAASPSSAFVQGLPEAFWLNGLEMGFVVSLIACGTYVLVSLLTRQPDVDFDLLFHRGADAADKPGEPTDHPRPTAPPVRLPAWQRAIGITPEFTRGDRVIFYLQIGYFTFAFGVGFLGLTAAWALGWMRTDDAWISWWTFKLGLIGLLGTVTTVWFLIGGFRDLFRMFAHLRDLQRDDEDDGVVRHRPVAPGAPES